MAAKEPIVIGLSVRTKKEDGGTITVTKDVFTFTKKAHKVDRATRSFNMTQCVRPTPRLDLASAHFGNMNSRQKNNVIRQRLHETMIASMLPYASYQQLGQMLSNALMLGDGETAQWLVNSIIGHEDEVNDDDNEEEREDEKARKMSTLQNAVHSAQQYSGVLETVASIKNGSDWLFPSVLDSKKFDWCVMERLHVCVVRLLQDAPVFNDNYHDYLLCAHKIIVKEEDSTVLDDTAVPIRNTTRMLVELVIKETPKLLVDARYLTAFDPLSIAVALGTDNDLTLKMLKNAPWDDRALIDAFWLAIVGIIRRVEQGKGNTRPPDWRIIEYATVASRILASFDEMPVHNRQCVVGCEMACEKHPKGGMTFCETVDAWYWYGRPSQVLEVLMYARKVCSILRAHQAQEQIYCLIKMALNFWNWPLRELIGCLTFEQNHGMDFPEITDQIKKLKATRPNEEWSAADKASVECSASHVDCNAPLLGRILLLDRNGTAGYLFADVLHLDCWSEPTILNAIGCAILMKRPTRLSELLAYWKKPIPEKIAPRTFLNLNVLFENRRSDVPSRARHATGGPILTFAACLGARFARLLLQHGPSRTHTFTKRACARAVARLLAYDVQEVELYGPFLDEPFLVTMDDVKEVEDGDVVSYMTERFEKVNEEFWSPPTERYPEGGEGYRASMQRLKDQVA